jgi:hypothetical protein
MTVAQVRMTIGDDAIDDLAQFACGSPGAITWQLAVVLPDLVDAVSPGGEVIDADRLARELWQASTDDSLVLLRPTGRAPRSAASRTGVLPVLSGAGGGVPEDVHGLVRHLHSLARGARGARSDATRGV